MIDSYTATSVLVAFILIFGLVIPILDKIPFVKNFISLRWSIVVIYSAMCLGVILDFSHLDSSVRFAVVIGGILLSSLFLVVRSLEKAAVNNWRFPRFRGRVQKGNTSGEISVNPKLESSRIKELSNFVVSQKEEDYDKVMNEALFIDKLKEEKESRDD